jgi:hypothetical protein
MNIFGGAEERKRFLIETCFQRLCAPHRKPHAPKTARDASGQTDPAGFIEMLILTRKAGSRGWNFSVKRLLHASSIKARFVALLCFSSEMVGEGRETFIIPA